MYNRSLAKFLGDIYELFHKNSQAEHNMDYWNNEVGRRYGKTTTTLSDLFQKLLLARKGGELIINPNDPRKYSNDKAASQIANPGTILVAKQSKTGENLTFYDPLLGKTMNKNEFIHAIKQGEYPFYEIRIILGKETPVSKKDETSSNNLD